MLFAVVHNGKNQAIRPEFRAERTLRPEFPPILSSIRQGFQTVVQHPGFTKGFNFMKILSQ